jgi:hypothetical protein
MSPRGRGRGHEREQDELRRYGLEHDPRADYEHELELADRLAEQASLPPGDAGARALARYRLGRAPSPYGRAGRPAPTPELAAGQEVTYRGEDGAGPARHGTVKELIDGGGAAVVAFHGGGETAVSADALERRPGDGHPVQGRRPGLLPLRAELPADDRARMTVAAYRRRRLPRGGQPRRRRRAH